MDGERGQVLAEATESAAVIEGKHGAPRRRRQAMISS